MFLVRGKRHCMQFVHVLMVEVGIVTRLQAGCSGIQFPAGTVQNIFLFSEMSSLSLGPTQIQDGSFAGVKMVGGVRLTTCVHIMLRLGMMVLYLYFLYIPSWCGQG
jgi:hypothetical protein